ncbi:hypothetical protein J5N97_023732 [Dioscorea zingiberensis]|uniref:Uncharacterized protein n=1 Tax=Dioscorea zingiberensis TaxID=325984 RepID=A0A9D5C5D8_9LILI|nr:hypothetical protein J5N97_023732 [Dioscorea zingiberensis]
MSPLIATLVVNPEKENNQNAAVDKAGNVVLDIENLVLPPDKCCSGSPKMTRALSRKGSWRMDRRNGEDQEADEASKKLVVKVVPSQLELLKQPLAPNKAAAPLNNPCLPETGDVRHKRFSRLTTIHPKKILLFFATMSSMGTMILIYFTLAIYRRGGV